MKRLISVLLTITMLLGITASVPLSVSAVTTDKVESGDTYTDEYGKWTYEEVYEYTEDVYFYCKGYRITGYTGNMTNVEIPSWINGMDVVEVGDYVFDSSSNPTSITIPDSVTTIGPQAFYGCSNLTSIIIPKNVTTIGMYAFYGCSSLTNITINDKVTTIGYYAFKNCNSLTDVYYTGSSSEWYSISIDYSNNCLTNAKIHYNYGEVIDGDINSGKYKDRHGVWYYELRDDGKGYKITGHSGSGYRQNIEIPVSINNLPVLEIADYAFESNDRLISVKIPYGVTTIGNYAFYRCYYLTSVTIPYGVITIGDYAFEGCSDLTNVTIPHSVTTIGKHAFWGCAELTELSIPNSVTTIGIEAFRYCSSLTNVTLSNSITTLDWGTFFNCNNLTSIIIPYGVTTIGNFVFDSCESLTSVTIPNSVTTTRN